MASKLAEPRNSSFQHNFSPSVPILFDIFCHSDANTQRETGKVAQVNNIQAAKAVADIIRTTLGPRSMLKVATNLQNMLSASTFITCYRLRK